MLRESIGWERLIDLFSNSEETKITNKRISIAVLSISQTVVPQHKNPFTLVQIGGTGRGLYSRAEPHCAQ